MNLRMYRLVPSLWLSILVLATGATAQQGVGGATSASAFADLVLNPPGLDVADYDRVITSLLSEVEHNVKAPFADVLLLRATTFLDRAADRGKHLDHLQKIAEANPGLGRLEPRIQSFIAERDLRRGDDTKILSTDYFPGTFRYSAVIGPFEDGVPSSITTPFGPEKDLDYQMTYTVPQLTEPIRWEALERRNFQAHFDLELSTLPLQGVKYLRAQFRSNRPRGCYLSLNAPGSVKVWLNSEFLYQLDTDTAATREQIPPIPSVVREGWNSLLIKLDGRFANWVSFRWIDGNGITIKDYEEEKELVNHPVGPVANIQTPAPYDKVDGRLTSWMSTLKDSKEIEALRAVRSWAISTMDRPSEALAGLREAAKTLADRADLQYMLAEVTLAASYLPQTEAKNRGRDAMEASLKLNDKFVPALLLKSDLLSRDDKMEEALTVLTQAEAIAPNCYLVWTRRAQIFQKLQWSSEHSKAVEKSAELAPNRSELLLEYSHDLRARLEVERANALVDRVAQLDRSNGSALNQQISRWFQNGEVARVIAEQERLLRLYQSDQLRESLANTLQSSGQVEKAMDIRRQVAARRKNDPAAAQSLVEALRETNHEEEAQKILDRLMNENSANAFARNWLRNVGGGIADESFFAKYRVDCMEAIKNYKPTKETDKAPDVLLVDQQIERVFPDGSTEAEITAVYRVNDQEGIRRHGSAQFRGELLQLRVVHPDGTYDEPTPAEGDYALPNLKPGDFVLVRSRVFDSAGVGERPSLGNFQFQSTDRPYIFTQYVLSLPKSSDLRLVERNFDGESEITETDSAVIHKYTKTNVPRILPEPFAPDSARYLPWVRAGWSRTVDDLHRFYRANQLRSMDVTEEIKQAAQSVVSSLKEKTDAAMAEAFYKFTNDTLVERAGNTATRSLIEKRGNPIALYGALLKAQGVPFDLVFARGIMEGADDDPEPDFLDTNRYGAVLFRVRPRESNATTPLWVDFSQKLKPFNDHPIQFSGSEALVVGEEGPERLTLPTRPMEEAAQAEVESTIDLKGGQEAIVKVKITLRGASSWAFRDQIRNQTADIRRTIVSSISNRFAEGIELQNFDFPGLDDPSKPMLIQFEGTVKNFLREGAGVLESPLLLAKGMPAREFAGKSKRKLPVRLRDIRYEKEKLTINLAANQTFGEVPANITKSGFTSNYNLKIQKSDKQLVVDRLFTRTPGTIPAADFPQFLALCREIEEAEQLKAPILENK